MLNGDRVVEVFRDCLLEDKEVVDGNPIVETIVAEGLMHKVGLHKARVEGHRAEIEGFIEELPAQFKEGWSFLNLCMDKDGNQWTGMHQTCDELVMLGVAIGKIKMCFPRDMWCMLPGGVPYIQVV